MTGMAGVALETAWLGRAWRHLERCASTNDEAAAWARAGAPSGAVVTADAQTKGRGRQGRAWYSPPGTSLYLSVVLRPGMPPSAAPPITLAAGVAVAEAIAQEGVSPQLKWPNDVTLGGRKVAGILTEMLSSGERIDHLVIGIGVNLNVDDFPDELRTIATSIARERGAPVDRARFAAALCERLEVWVERFYADGAQAVVAGWRTFAGFLGRTIAIAAGAESVSGVAEDLEPDGALRLRTADGRVLRVIAGEVVT